MSARGLGLAVLVFSLSVVMITAAVWQYQRGGARQQARAVAADAMSRPAVTMAASDLPATEGQVHVALAGRFVADRQLLLDNQTQGGRAGYHVWTPLETPAGDWVIVDRGWIPAPARRDSQPDWTTPTTTGRVTGRWAALPKAGLETAATDCEGATFPARLHYPDAETVACVLGRSPVPGRLLLAADAPHGFSRQWQASGLPPERHYGYALQWAALTLALWILTWIGVKYRAR